MSRIKWLTVCALLILRSTQLFGEGQQDTRHFNFNPNNLMGGMVNPMQNIFNGSNRNQGGYNNYYNDPYYPAQPYPYYPQSYGQPPTSYGAPSTPYSVNPGYQQQPAAQNPGHSEQAAPVYQQAPAPRATTTYNSSPQGQYKFRPMDRPPASDNSAQNLSMPHLQPPSYEPQATTGYYPAPNPSAASNYPQGYQQSPQPPAYPSNTQGGISNNAPYSGAYIQADPSMKFRPLDQPGYSQ